MREPPLVRILTLGTVLLSLLARTEAGAAASPASPQPTTNLAGLVSLAGFTHAETRRWQSVPRGTQICDGVSFLCNGAVRTAGLHAAREGNRYPGAVLGVPVNRRGSRLHLLQAVENGTEMVEGLPYGRLILHYATGESRRVDLLFGIQGDEWLQDPRARNDPVADANSKVGWLQRRQGDGTIVRLYHTALENPLPNVTLEAVDVLTTLREANLLLFGLTIDDDPRPLRPSYGPGESIGDTRTVSISFTLQDATGQPAAGATLAWTAYAPQARVDFPPVPADSQGRVSIEVPRASIRRIQYKATAPSGGSASGELDLSGPSSTWTQPVIKLAL